jgi:hypothetical protein
MKTIFYNNSLAKLMLAKGFAGIMLFGFVLFTRKKEEVSKNMIDHEKIHQMQYLDCFFLCLIPAVYLVIMYSICFLMFPVCFYYLLYLMEYFLSAVIRFFIKRKEKDGAYYTNALEMQAYAGIAYKHFGWIKYYGKI